MRKILVSAFLVLSQLAYAKDIAPKSIGVQYELSEDRQNSFIAFNITIAAQDFVNMRFGKLGAFVVETGDDTRQLVPSQLVYAKAPEHTIMGSEIVSFQYRGGEAQAVINNLKSLRILLRDDIGSDDLRIDIAGICKAQPGVFFNLAGGSPGCP